MTKYIDADKLLDSMARAARDLDTEGITDVDDMLDAMEEAMRDCVNQMPAEDVAPVKHGKWVNKTTTERLKIELCRCSECGTVRNWKEVMHYNHCPDCGAKMKREEKI